MPIGNRAKQYAPYIVFACIVFAWLNSGAVKESIRLLDTLDALNVDYLPSPARQ